MNAELEARAKKLYQTSPNQVKPTWDQIGEVTKGVWMEMVASTPLASSKQPGVVKSRFAKYLK